jgi:hypothetical protein
MNTENRKCCCRYLIFILFWAVIIALGFMLIPRGGSGSGGAGNGSGQYGRGSGSGDHGSGSGKGQGSSGKHAGTAAESKNSVSPIAENGRQGKNKQKDPSGSGQLPIASKDKSNDNIATIYLPGRNSGPASGSGTSTGFFGVEASGSVIFLLDVSSSMGARTSDSDLSRLELVKKEVEKSLADRHIETRTRKTSDRFRIVCFSSGCRFFPDQSTPGYRFSSMQEVAEAIDFVKALSPGGGTQMKNAWQAIIPIIRAEGIQSVFFLSDGEPQDCDSVSLTAFLKNEVPNLTIHSISMGQFSELLKNVSRQHHGQYKEVR